MDERTYRARDAWHDAAAAHTAAVNCCRGALLAHNAAISAPGWDDVPRTVKNAIQNAVDAAMADWMEKDKAQREAWTAYRAAGSTEPAGSAS